LNVGPRLLGVVADNRPAGALPAALHIDWRNACSFSQIDQSPVNHVSLSALEL
jgi:hypothetical protein